MSKTKLTRAEISAYFINGHREVAGEGAICSYEIKCAGDYLLVYTHDDYRCSLVEFACEMFSQVGFNEFELLQMQSKEEAPEMTSTWLFVFHVRY